MQRDTRIVLAAIIGSVLVLGICFAIWVWSEPYRPQWDLPSQTQATP